MRPISTAKLLFLFTAAVFIGMVLPGLFSEGMFADGVIYANVSMNLAEGWGSFWNLHLTKTFIPDFYEHPPLTFAMQSLLFKLFGNGLYTEGIYSLLTAVITAYIIILLWKQSTEKKYHSFAWLPILLWIIIPLTSWAVRNNMLENTVMVFTSLSAFFTLKSLQKSRFLYLFLSGFMLFCAFLTKGFVGLFPLSFLFFLWLTDKSISFKRFITGTLITTCGLCIPFVLLYFFSPEGMAAFEAYINNQVIRSLELIQTVNSRFNILWQFTQQIIPLAVFLILAYFLSKLKKRKFEPGIKQNRALPFFLLCLSGILPIIVSLKQRGFYIAPAMPFAALAGALFILPYIHSLTSAFFQKEINKKIFLFLTVIMLTAATGMSAYYINKPGRDIEILADVKTISEYVPEGAVISTERAEFSNLSLQSYLYRYAHISLDRNQKNLHKYYLATADSTYNIPDNFEEINIGLKKYILYEKED